MHIDPIDPAILAELREALTFVDRSNPMSRRSWIALRNEAFGRHGAALLAEIDRLATIAAIADQWRRSTAWDDRAAHLSRLEKVLRKHAAIKCSACDGMSVDMSAEEDRPCLTCGGSGAMLPPDVIAALAEGAG